MLGGTIGQFAVGQFIDLSDSTPTEDTTSDRKPLLRKGTTSRAANFWKGRQS